MGAVALKRPKVGGERMGQVDNATAGLGMPLTNPLGWVAGGVNHRRRSQSRRMSGSGQSESAFRTWRNGMRLRSGLGSGTRIELATSWSAQTRRFVGAARSINPQEVASEVWCDCRK